MKQLPPQSTTIPALFIHSDIQHMETERERLKKSLKRMREKHMRGAIQRTEFRLRELSGRILATAYGKPRP